MQRANSLVKTPVLGKIEGRRRRGQQRMRWLDNINNTMDMNLRRTEEPGVLQSMRSKTVRQDSVIEQQITIMSEKEHKIQKKENQ